MGIVKSEKRNDVGARDRAPRLYWIAPRHYFVKSGTVQLMATGKWKCKMLALIDNRHQLKVKSISADWSASEDFRFF